ncbi:NIPSNAP family protein [Pseudomonas putida]
MLIEHRVYNLHLGAEELFWEAQRERGEQGLQPIFERLLGVFASRSGPTDQIVSLYRYDSFEDWHSRLYGIYGQARLQPYFRVIRPLIASQQSKFLLPAPLPELTPHWGNSRDWLPGEGPLFDGQALVEQTTLSFSAGGVPACWEAFRRHALDDDPVALEGMLGAFASIVGSLNEVLILRRFSCLAALQEHRRQRHQSAAWTSFLRSLAPLTIASDVRLLEPSQVADMSPLFAR